MNIFDLLEQDEIDGAPEDPATAFTELVGRAQRRLSLRTNALQDEDQISYRIIEDAQYGFMNVVIALAKAYKIEPFASLEVPRYENFDFDVHRQFKADLDHYMTQLLVNNSIKARRDSVRLLPKVKDKIRSYIHELKLAIDKANFTDAKRADLHARLAEFESELEKSRLTLLAVTKFAFCILVVPGGIWSSYEVVAKLTNNVLQAVGEAKAVDDENRKLPQAPTPVALLPPRKDDGKLRRETTDDDLDDEIPF